MEHARDLRLRGPGQLTKMLILSAIVFPTLWGGEALAQSPAPMSNTELSKESENPVSRVIRLPLRYEAEFDNGSRVTKHILEIDHALVPFRLTEDWTLITRTKLPAEALPPKQLGENWTTGLGNGNTTFFLSPEHGNGFYWGVGPVLYYPASTEALGVNKWGAGPSVAFIKKDASPWVFGAVINNIWSFGGAPPESSNRTNKLLLNPLVSYHFGDGWAVSASPNITANWIAAGEKWTVPIGGGLSKTQRADGQSLKLALEAYYNAIRPDPADDAWDLKATLTLLFPEE